ncbi:aquaporin-like protein [Decorospora gaudefroyi]|uniref:Aquaporin-like protein n=1 Tax=Decorospora gaudefroyi TaxID=184978 RepID=A0A6A5KSW7_9PLEO|nr:aquaporin-like protein [Decorospora gaudefroyi]
MNRVPVLPQHGKNEHTLSVTNSQGHIYLLDQFREKVPLPIRNRAIAMLSEFVGTFLFILMGLGGNSAVINNFAIAQQYKGGDIRADPAKILYLGTVWGLAITVNAWTFFRISGGLFNPAVTMAMMVTRAVPPLDGFLDIFSQLAGAIMAAAIAYALFPPGSLAGTTLGPTTSVTQGLFIEMFITAQVVIAIFLLATEKNKATYIAPVGIGMAVAVSVMMASAYTGAALNPARSFAVCVIQGSFPPYHWIYWIGPGMGALLATGFYHMIRKLEYWTVNPDVDQYETKVGQNIREIASRVSS